MASIEQHEGDMSEISSLTDSSDEGKKVVEEIVEAEEEADKPAYSEEDLETLVGFIRGMIILFDYDDEDFNEEVAEVIKLWLTDANNPLLFVFYDGNRLAASLAFPLCPINDLMYFMREQDQLFSALEQFHDDILFGTLHGDIEGSLLVLLEQVYGPMILSNVDWSENVKANVVNGFNAFMTYLTELHYKLSGFTLLYVPREGSDMAVQEVVLNRSMIKRLEAVVIDWTGLIRATLADTQHFVPDDLVCPSDEYSFWVYRHEVLSAIRLQYKGPNVQHIVRILELAQSLYIKHLKDVLEDLDKEIGIAASNIPFLKLLVDPCFAIGTLETADDFCSQLIYVMHIIRLIGQDSHHLNKDDSITKLFLYLSNEIVACCMHGIDVGRILSGAPRYGIDVCKMKINCCESYKIIYEEMLEHFKEEFPWNLDYAAIFNRINSFLQRLNDILEICDAMLIFGKYAESTAYTSYRFFCNNADEFERQCEQVEKIFHSALEAVEAVGGTILDVNNKDWYRHIGEFREMLKGLDDIIENLLSNVFLMSENLEEKLNVLVTLLNFYRRENIRESFMRKIGEVWSMLNEETMQLSKDVSAGITQYPALLPPHAGRYAVLKMRFDHLTHLRTLIVNCRFFPEHPLQEEVLALYEVCEKQVKGALKGLYDAWCKSIPTTETASWYQRYLICRSHLRPGLFEVNIERRLLVLFDEAHYFKTLGVAVPMGLDLEKHEHTRLTFDNVLRLVLYFNGVVSSISDKERLFFKPMIQQTERKLEPLRSKLTWEEDLSEFIEGYVVSVRELLDLIELYKRENQRITSLVERMYGMVFVRLEQAHPVSMAQLMASVAEQKKAVFTELLGVLTEISQSIFTVYDRLGSHIRKMGSSWEQYLHKIDKLLKAAIFMCTLNTLRGVQTSLENVHSSPIVLIEILLKRDGAVYDPGVEAVEQTLRRLVEEVCLTIKPVPTMADRYQLESGERSFYLQLLEHPDYANISGSINGTIDDTVGLLRTYQAKWNVFRPFWCVEKAAFIERFKLSAMTSDAFQTNIEKFEELQNQLSTQGDFIVCRCVEIDALKLKYALTSHIGEWQTKYVDYLKCIAYGKIIDFNNVLRANVEELRHEPKEVYELKRLEERYQACSDELAAKEHEIAIILKFFAVLEKYVADLLPEAYELRRDIGKIWAQYRADLEEIRERIENYQDQFKLSMTGAAEALKVDALEMLEMLRREMQASDDSSPAEAFEAIDRLMARLEELERREREVEERMRLLGVGYVRSPVLEEIRSRLENLRLVWTLIEEWRLVRDRVMSENYLTADELELSAASGHFREVHESLAQRLPAEETFDAFVRAGEEIAQFTATVRIVCAMRSSFLQDRHWGQVKEIAKCATPVEPTASSSFRSVSNMRLYRYEDELLALCLSARMEHEVEVDLEAVALRVRSIQFQSRKSAGVDVFPGLLNAPANVSALADNAGIINRLRNSPHRHPFQPLVDYWEETVGLLEEILEVLMQMESECRTLFELYRLPTANEGGPAEMADFREGFRGCFAQWRELMRYISSARLVEDICPVGREYIAELEAVRKRIEQLARMLRDILEDERQSFPRFYLLSDRQLVVLLSRPMDCALLEQSLGVMFENVARLHRSEQEGANSPERRAIGGVYTRDEEHIPFTDPLFAGGGNTRTAGNVRETMGQVERGIRHALRDLLPKCHAALRAGYFRRVESGWLRRWPLQLCLKSAEMQHTLHTRNALVQCRLLGRNKPLKMLRFLHTKLVRELTASARGEPSDRWQRKKLNDLLIVELNARDLIERLCGRPELHGLESFEWVSQLHSSWHAASRRCTVQLLDARFSYGYECKRATEPMLVTPVSERARMATICAIRAEQIPALLGTSGASCGRRVLLDSLAHSLGVLLLTFDCGGSVLVEALLRIVVGMKKLGGWLALAGLERLPSAAVIQIADCVRDKSGDGHRKSALVETAKEGLHRAGRFQLFSLAVANGRGVQTLTKRLDRTLFRPIVFTPADRAQVLECWFRLANFDHSGRMAKLVCLFLDQMQLLGRHLSEQGLFSLRRMRQVIESVEMVGNASPRTLHAEEQALVRAFMRTYRSSFTDTDLNICRNGLALTFGQLEELSEDSPEQALAERARERAHEMNLHLSDGMLEKVLRLHQSLLHSGRPVAITGGPGTGKSRATTIALELMVPRYEVHRLVPNALRMGTQPALFDRPQLDGIISKALRSTASFPAGGKCLIFDSVPDAEWVECVARLAELEYTACDFTRPTIPNVKVVLECVGPLETMTPSVVSRFTLLHMGPGDLRWEDLVEGWLRQKSEPFLRARLGELMGKCFASSLSFRRAECPASAKLSDVTLARTFCHLWDQLLADVDRSSASAGEASETHEACRPETLVKLFFFCAVWAIGGSLDDEASRAKYDLYLREQHPEAGFPLKGSVFHYHVDIPEGAWRSWEAKLPAPGDGALLDDRPHYRSAYVRSPQTVAYEFLALALMRNGAPVLLASETAVGKTALLEAAVSNMEPSRWCAMRIACTQRTTPAQLRSRLRCHALQITKNRLYPERRRRMVCFVDDLHTAQSNPYAAGEFVRGLLEGADWYEGATAVRLEQCQLVAAMRLQRCGTGLPPAMRSLLNKCHVLVVTPPAEDQLGQIFTGMIRSAVGAWASGDARLGPVFQLLAPATVDFVGRLRRTLPPTPSRLRYQFSLGTIASIVRSLCSCIGATDGGGERGALLRLWIHECYRETWDRLERADRRRFHELLSETLSQYFDATLHGLCPNNQGPIYTDVLGENGCGANPYEDVRDTERLIAHAERQWNKTVADALPEKLIIIHREAVEHATRVLRTIRLAPGRGTMLMGRPGSGRTLACQLAARLSPDPLAFHRMPARARDAPEAIERAFLTLFQACQRRRTLAMISLDDLVEAGPNERLLELVSGIVSGEELPVLFCGGGGASEQRRQVAEDADEPGAIEWPKVRANFHLVICLPLEASAYSIVLQRYPSLARNLAVDCVHDWSEATLLEISKKYLLQNIQLNVPIQGTVAASGDRKTRRRESLIQSTEERLQLATHDLLFRIHYAVQTEPTLPTDDGGSKRDIIAPCSWYFELLDTFERVLREKRVAVQAAHGKFRVGIERIEDAAANVASLSEALEQRQQEIELFQQQLDAFLGQIARQTQEADEQTEEVSVKRVKIGAEEAVCKQLAELAGADLERAMPALTAAVAALDSLNKKDMNEIKSYSRPPTKVELVMEAVMILLGREPTWAEAKRQLGEQKFLDTLKGFDRNSIAERTLKTIGAYVRNPELEPEKVGAVSRAAKSLMLWVRAIDNYGKVYRYVGPKIRKMEHANASLLEKQRELDAAERRLVELSAKLARLRTDYDGKMAEKRQLEETAREMALTLERARALVDNLGGERARWLSTTAELEAGYERLVGDALLAAGCLTYLGPATAEARASALAQWLVELEAVEMPCTRPFALTAFFYEPGVPIRWHENGLPPGEFCADNATILLNSTRTALIADPQEEAQRWVLAELHRDGKLLDFDDEISESTLVDTFQRHVPVMLENINRANVCDLDAVFALQEAAAAACRKCRGKRGTPWGEREAHAVYLFSREPLPIGGALLKRINQLCFVLGAEGLEVKLLGLLVRTENPMLEERREELQQTIVRNNRMLADVKEQILRVLNESQTPLLEDQELHLLLESSRATFQSVSRDLQAAEQARLDVEASREVYRSCAARAALLFLVLEDLPRVNALYRYSLEWYMALFLLSLDRSGRVQQLAERKRRIDECHTYNVFRSVSRGLFENDRKLFAFYLCVRLLFAEEALSAREFRFLVHGARGVDRQEQMDNPCRGWLTESQWDQLTGLDRLPGFHGIVESFAEWPAEWRRWYTSPAAEEAPLAGGWEQQLRPFQKYLIVRCLRLDRIERCMANFTRDRMGPKFADLPRGSLEEALQESSPRTLVLLLLRGSASPLRRVERLRRKTHPSPVGGFESLSMAEGRLEAFVGLLKQCIADESWLYVGDCHRSVAFLKQLPHVVAFLRHVASNSRFRLVLGSEPHEALPVSVLQSCIKLAFEEPKSIRQLMETVYEELGETRFKKTTSPMKQTETTSYKRLLFSLAFLHGLLLQRNNFQRLGWLEPYHFVNNDFALAERLLSYALEKLLVTTANERGAHRWKAQGRANAPGHKQGSSSGDVSLEDDFRGLGDDEQQEHDSTPWQFIKEVVLELCYGAQIGHCWDRRIYETYKEELFHPRLLLLPPSATAASALPARGWFRLPRDGTYQTYVDFIARQLPDHDGIDVFGQHENANVKYLKSRSGYALRMLARVAKVPEQPFHPLAHHAGQEDERTKQTISDLLSTLPVYLDYEGALRIVGAGASRRTPVCDALLGEVCAYNATLARVRADADCALRTLTGATNELLWDGQPGKWSALFEALRQNRVPQGWSADAGQNSLATADASLSDWLLELRECVQYFRRWAETGQLPVEIVLARFTNPKRFLNGVLQHYANSHDVPFEEVQWSFTVYATVKPLERFPVEEGLIVRGLLLENGSWSWEKQTLAIPDILEMVCPMPPIAFRPTRRPVESGTAAATVTPAHYRCPLFHSTPRAEETYVLSIPLPCGEQQDEAGWIKYNTALLVKGQ